MEHFVKRAMIALFLGLFSTGVLACAVFQFNLKEQLCQENRLRLEDVQQSLDAIFSPEERYGLINTDKAYLARIKPILLTGYSSNDAEITTLSNSLRFLASAKGNTGAVYSIYVALLDEEAAYLLTDTGMKCKKYLRDSSWIASCGQTVKEDFCEFRSIGSATSSSSAVTNVLTVYHYISSTHWETGESIDGCIVINYYLSPIMMQLRGALPSSNSCYILKTENGQIGTNQTSYVLTGQDGSDSAGAAYQDRRFEYFHQRSGCLDIEYLLLCPKKELYRLVHEQNIAMILLAGAMLIVSIYFFTIYQNQHKKYFNNIRKILQITTEDDASSLALELPEGNYSDLANRVLKHTVDRIEMKELLAEEHSKRAEMELLALQSQINPHFLLNTIDFIYWSQISDFGIESVQAQMMEHLCQMLKYALDTSSIIVPLREELENAVNYISIQKARKRCFVEFLLEIPEELEAMGVMKLILQPVLENCFQHGLRGSSGGEIRVRLTARKTGELLEIRVSDNGLGIDPDKMEQINQNLSLGKVKRSHIGIPNINRRLQLYYGPAAGVRFEPAPSGGCVAVLRMKAIELET